MHFDLNSSTKALVFLLRQNIGEVWRFSMTRIGGCTRKGYHGFSHGKEQNLIFSFAYGIRLAWPLLASDLTSLADCQPSSGSGLY